jgi:RNA polymerase sigma-70 factor (ECF subfamily)
VDEVRDEELVRRFVGGDQGAFAELVRRHERRVYNLAYRMLGREEDARDAAQEAFLSALRKLPGFRGEAAFTTWLHRVTVNTCYDALRKRKHEPLLELDREDDERGPSGPEPTSADHADAAVAVVEVHRALQLVPQEFRAVLILHDAQDLGYEEIGEVLGIPVGTVKSRLHRGRIALARALEGPDREPAPAPRPSDGTVHP